MTDTNNLTTKPIHPATVSKRLLQGAAIGLILIAFFLIGVDKAKPEWPTFWMIKPLLMVSAAGALGGLFHYNMDHLRSQGGWREAFAHLLSLVVFVVVLWLGIVLGLHGTMWD
jgi:hypothetical protein